MRTIFLMVVSLLAVSALGDTAAVPSLASLADKARSLARLADTARKQGTVLPADLYPAVCRALSANGNYTSAELAAYDGSLDSYREVLTTLMSTPGIVGTTRMNAPERGALVAGTTVTVSQTYIPGRTLGPGSALLVAGHWMDPWLLQADDPDDSSYVTVAAGQGSARFSVSSVARGGIDGGRYADVKLPVFEVESGNIAAGQPVTIRYSKLRLPGRAAREFPLPVYVRLARGGPFLPVPQSSLAVAGGPLYKMAAYAPSIVATGTPFKVFVKFTDRFGNPATGSLPPLDVLVDGSVRARVPAGTAASPSASLTLEEAGSHEVTVSSAGGGLSASATVQVEDNPAYLVRWADLNVHTARSDALEADDEIVQRLSGTLDDIFLIDHDDQMSGVDWVRRRTQALDGFDWSALLRSGGDHVVLSAAPLAFTESPRLRFPTLGDLMEGIKGPDALIVALPEIPADARFVNPGVMRLVEIKAGTGTFEWFGNRFAGRGYRVGFTGSSSAHNHQAGPPASTGRTAVMVKPGESLFDALRARRTWVTSGPRILLDVKVNEGLPGERVTPSAERKIEGKVIGTAAIARIELLRNGELAETRDLAGDTASQTVRISFDSSSAPIHGHNDLPRNGREWIGFVKVKGASLAALDGSNFRNTTRQAVAVNPADPARADFITWTRGQASSFSVDLGDEADDASLELSLRSGFEDDDQIPLDRKPAPIPPLRLVVSMQELHRGRVIRRYDVDGYTDTVTFELVQKQPPNRAEFSFTDERPYGEGDYYYIRVTQADDAMAWSSPVWVGGFDPR